VPKIIQIGQCLLNLHLKLSEMFFETQCIFDQSAATEARKIDLWPLLTCCSA